MYCWLTPKRVQKGVDNTNTGDDVFDGPIIKFLSVAYRLRNTLCLSLPHDISLHTFLTHFFPGEPALRDARVLSEGDP